MGFSSDQPLLTNQVVTSVNLPSVEDQELFNDRLEARLSKMADIVNTKEGALYSLKEQATFQQYYVVGDPQATRNVYRRVINFGALPDTDSKPIAHGVTFSTDSRLTRLYGAATDPDAISFLPLPFASPTAADNIQLEVDGTNVIITTGSDRTAYTNVSVVLEYTK